MAPSSDRFDRSSDGPAWRSDDEMGLRETGRVFLESVRDHPAILVTVGFVAILPVAVFGMRVFYPQGLAFAALAWIGLAVVLRRRGTPSEILWRLWLAAVLYLWLLPYWVAVAETGQLFGPVTTFFSTFIPIVYTYFAVKSV
jgi:hypothetical protein